MRSSSKIRTCILWLASALAIAPQGLVRGGTIQDIKHVVILMQENRSFDHYFGAFRGVRGFSDPNAITLPSGNSVFFQPSNGGFVLPFHITNQCQVDVHHGWLNGLAAWNGGKWDQWLPAKGPGAMAHYQRADIPFYYSLAENYTICDNYFCSVAGPTGPNRLFAMTGSLGPNPGVVLTNVIRSGSLNWTTYPERLQAAGVTWRVYEEPVQGEDYLNPLTWFAQYTNAVPGNPLFDRGIATVPSVVGAFRADLRNNTLPQVSWIIPAFTFSEHPPAPPAYGEFFTQQILAALAENPAILSSTAVFLVYDENGGYFDHVPSPLPPRTELAEYVNGLPIGPGVRVPMIIISPWTKGGFICSELFDHTSLLRFLEKWTGVTEPNISTWKRQACGDLTSAFDFEHPDFSTPVLPPIPPISCGQAYLPSVPESQTEPRQEPGCGPVRTIACQPNGYSLIDCSADALWIQLTNSGSASVHLSIYASKPAGVGPWQFDVPGTASTALVLTNVAAGYDVSCYGPNGFHRRFAGSPGSGCGLMEVHPVLDLDTASISLRFQNASSASVIFSVTNALLQDAVSFAVAPGSSDLQQFQVLNPNTFYDFTVMATGDTNFVRRFAGRLELEPLNLAIGQREDGMLQLSYPIWASSFAVERSTNCVWGPWQQLPNPPERYTNRMVLVMPTDSGSAFYRLGPRR